MTDALQVVDWDFIQALYLKGVTPKAISEQTGVKADRISVHASRKGWTRNLRKIAQSVKVTETVSVEKTEDSALSKQSQAVRSALGRDLERVCRLLEDRPPSSLPNALKRQSELEPVVRNAAKVFGWSEGSAEPAVRINILSQVKPADDRPVIDVTPKEIDKPAS